MKKFKSSAHSWGKITPMLLYMTPRSPFARRARLALLRLNLPFERHVTDAFNPSPQFLEANPLALIPVLTLPSGQNIPDSATILEYLGEKGGIWPKDPEKRLQVRIASTLAEGLMTNTVNRYLENQRDHPDSSWREEFEANIKRTLGRISLTDLEGLPWVDGGQLTQAGWDLAVALEYFDCRMPDWDWRPEFPKLGAFLERHESHPLLKETAPPPA